ncbi:uncharacterized protein LOC144323128 [Canis aureus]
MEKGSKPDVILSHTHEAFPRLPVSAAPPRADPPTRTWTPTCASTPRGRGCRAARRAGNGAVTTGTGAPRRPRGRDPRGPGPGAPARHRPPARARGALPVAHGPWKRLILEGREIRGKKQKPHSILYRTQKEQRIPGTAPPSHPEEWPEVGGSLAGQCPNRSEPHDLHPALVLLQHKPPLLLGASPLCLLPGPPFVPTCRGAASFPPVSHQHCNLLRPVGARVFACGSPVYLQRPAYSGESSPWCTSSETTAWVQIWTLHGSAM